jgi:hypothetical protein
MVSVASQRSETMFDDVELFAELWAAFQRSLHLLVLIFVQGA